MIREGIFLIIALIIFLTPPVLIANFWGIWPAVAYFEGVLFIILCGVGKWRAKRS